MQSCELVATITAIACAIANNCSEDEISVLAAAFNQLGDTLATILAREDINNNQKDIDNDRKNSNNNLKNAKNSQKSSNNNQTDCNKDVEG
ncbi:MAG: DUF6774 domain-containing protein [Anaerocolumna sp.]